MPEYHSLSINNLNDFIFGISPQPVILQNGLTIGGGTVYPELNLMLTLCPKYAINTPRWSPMPVNGRQSCMRLVWW